MFKPLLTRKCAFVVLAVGFLLLVLCLTLMLIFPIIYRNLLHKQLALLEGTVSFERWKKIPLPIYERLYFFNITNADEFQHHGAKLNVTEVGPYTYRSTWEKYDIGWFANHTVSYREVRTYHFVPELSNGTEDDVIVTLNGPLLMVANILKDFSVPVKLAASIWLGIENEKIIIQKSVRKLTYEGYEDPIIKYSIYVLPQIPYKDGKFGWLYGKNATDDGLLTVFTGEDDIQKLNMVDNWNGDNSLSFWNGRTCDMINGTNVEMGPPLKDNQETYTFYQSLLCRSWTLQYSGEESEFGITSKKFIVTSSLMANGSENPDNTCFDTEKMTPSGVQDLSSCQFGAPIYMSFPHFYLGDPSYLQSVDGLDPKAGDHSSYINVHPLTGFSTDITVRFQINLKLEKVRGILQLDRIREGIFPVLWVELHASLDEDFAQFLKDHLDNPKIIFYSTVGVFLAISVCMIVGASVRLVILWTMSKDDDEPLINPNKDKTSDSERKSTHRATLSNAMSPPEEGNCDDPLLDAGVVTTRRNSKNSFIGSI